MGNFLIGALIVASGAHVASIPIMVIGGVWLFLSLISK